MSSITRDPNNTSGRSNAIGTPSVTGSTEWRDRLPSILSFTQGLVPLLVAIIVLWWFGTVLKEMLARANSEVTAEAWSRYTYLYSGLEALAYAAAGFLFGREVNRQRADRAEESAANSQEIAFEAQSTAAVSVANGEALAAGVRALDDVTAMRPEADGAEAAPGSIVQVSMLRRMADNMFPSARR
jgi:hypothetical protein